MAERKFIQAWVMIEGDKVTVLTELTEFSVTEVGLKTELPPPPTALPVVEVRKVEEVKPPKRAPPKDHSYEILEAFKGETRALHITEISERCGIANTSTCSNALSRVVNTGILKRAKKGWFYDPKFCKNPLIAKPNSGMEFTAH